MSSLRTYLGSGIEKAALAALIFFIGRNIANIMSSIAYRRIIIKQGGDEYGKKMASIIKRLVKALIVTFIFLSSLNILGFNVTWLMGGITFAIGYAMQEILGNMFASTLLMTNPQYALGDIVQVLGDINVFGTIEAINVRNTTIKGFDHRTTIIPNMILVKTPIKTFSEEELIRYKLSISVPRDANLPELQELIKTTVNQHPQVVQEEYTTVTVNKFNEQGLLLDIYFFDNPQTPYSSFIFRSEIRSNIFTALKKTGIVIPYPRRLLINK